MTDTAPRKFLLWVLLWMPVTFVLWYWMAPILLVPVQWLSELVLTRFFDHAIKEVGQEGIYFDMVTIFGSDLLDSYQEGQPVGEVLFRLNALKYGYGVPLIAAMILATPNPLKAKLLFFVVAFLLLLPVQVWGVCCEALITIVFKLGDAIHNQMRMTRFSREMLALCYQLGYLIFPAIMPILIWAMMHRPFVRELIPNHRSPEKPNG